MIEKLKKIAKNRYTLFSLLFIVVVLIVYLLMTARAYIPVNVDGTNQSMISFSSCATIGMSDTGEYITLENTYPVSDNVGVNTDPYEFSITNECTESKTMSVYLVVNDSTTINTDYINLYYGKDGSSLSITTFSDYETFEFASDYISQYTSLTDNSISTIYTLGTYTVSENSSEEFSLRLWIDSEAIDVENQTFNATIVVADSDTVGY